MPVEHSLKIKESEKRDKYLDLAKELRKLWDIKVTEVPIVIGALGMISKGLERGLDNRKTTNEPRPSSIKIGQNTEKSPETWRDFLSLEKTARSKIMILRIIFKVLTPYGKFMKFLNFLL